MKNLIIFGAVAVFGAFALFAYTNNSDAKINNTATSALFFNNPIVSSSTVIGTVDANGIPLPIDVNGKHVEYVYTDDNTGEDLIIYLDREVYTNGLSHAEAFATVHNISGKVQDVELAGFFRNSNTRITDISVLYDVTREYYEPIYEDVCEFDGTTTICIQITTGNSTTTKTEKEWVSVPLVERTTAEINKENSNMGDVARKNTDSFIGSNKSTSYTLPIGGVLYYKVFIQYPVNVVDYWFLEAYGSKKGYGHLL